MNEVSTLAGALTTYGVYTVIACLIVAVVYLFRQVNDLHKQIQAIYAEQSKSNSEMITKVTIALDSSTKVIERIESLLLDRRI